MPSKLSTDGYERRRWSRALRLADRGMSPEEIVKRTGVKRSTFFYRMAKLAVSQSRKSDLSHDLYDL